MQQLICNLPTDS